MYRLHKSNCILQIWGYQNWDQNPKNIDAIKCLKTVLMIKNGDSHAIFVITKSCSSKRVQKNDDFPTRLHLFLKY